MLDMPCDRLRGSMVSATLNIPLKFLQNLAWPIHPPSSCRSVGPCVELFDGPSCSPALHRRGAWQPLAGAGLAPLSQPLHRPFHFLAAGTGGWKLEANCGAWPCGLPLMTAPAESCLNCCPFPS